MGLRELSNATPALLYTQLQLVCLLQTALTHIIVPLDISTPPDQAMCSGLNSSVRHSILMRRGLHCRAAPTAPPGVSAFDRPHPSHPQRLTG